MPRVFMSDKEAAAVAVVVESYMLRYPNSATAEMLSQIPERINRCIELQGIKKAATPKDSDTRI